MTGNLTIDAIEDAVKRALLAKPGSPWLDNEGAAAYLACTPGTLKTWLSIGVGSGPRIGIQKGPL